MADQYNHESVMELNERLKANVNSDQCNRVDLVHSVKVEVLTKNELIQAAGKWVVMHGRIGVDIPSSPTSLISKYIEKSLNHNVDMEGRGVFTGSIVDKVNVIEGEDVPIGKGRKTSLVKIDLESCGTPQYEPGDHIRVYPRNNISGERLNRFLKHLSEEVNLEDWIYVTCDDSEMSSSSLKTYAPLLAKINGSLVCVKDLFDKDAALTAALSMDACLGLSLYAAAGSEKELLTMLGRNEEEYEGAKQAWGLRWIDVFEIFPSLSRQLSIGVLLCNMKPNHIRSYSIASCMVSFRGSL